MGASSVSSDDLPAKLRELLGEDGIGCARELIERAAQQPEALGAFGDWTRALEQALPPRVARTIALTVATQTRDETARREQVRAARAAAMTGEEIEALERMRVGGCPTFSDQEVAAAALARCLLDDTGRGCDAALLRLSRLLGEAATTACLMLAARCVAHATMANAWSLGAPPAPPPSGRRRAG